MPRFLPALADYAAYQRFKSSPGADWLPVLRELAGRHGVSFASATRFSSGENPVFSLDGRHVLKLVPLDFWPQVIRREGDSLAFLQGKGFPSAQLVGQGERDGWGYLLCTQLAGESFAAVWPRLGQAERRRTARAFGALLAALHRLPVGNLRPAGLAWDDFLRDGAAAWSARGSVQALPPELRASGPDYIRAAELEADASPLVLLHGDLAPENCLVALQGQDWEFTGVFDFGNALAGRALFDLTAATVLLAPLDAATLREFLSGYGRDPSWLERERRRLMAYSLLHPLAHLPALLDLVPGLKNATSWDDVAAKYWPEIG